MKSKTLSILLLLVAMLFIGQAEAVPIEQEQQITIEQVADQAPITVSATSVDVEKASYKIFHGTSSTQLLIGDKDHQQVILRSGTAFYDNYRFKYRPYLARSTTANNMAPPNIY